ncbi:Muskelin N-terminus-domain-containing protein [Phycomyces blakesleeanus]|uniref:Muskelin N-terminus-domain-containing protein n=1 Tax=Phycomyces blakesleeanus TaxID=4837 RepID=A0ABR3AJD4_PHYBL
MEKDSVLNSNLAEYSTSEQVLNEHSKLVMTTITAPSSQKKIPYTVFDCSSHSGLYYPQNICYNNPEDLSSRWSSGVCNQTQYITLRFDSPAIARTILFGKYHESHVCNLKEFKVYGGMNLEDMTEILHQGLRNDNQPEEFPLRHAANNMAFPVQYIKIVPLTTFGEKFNYSIWYIEFCGVTDKDIIQKVVADNQKLKEIETVRLCLKHFRQRNMMDIFRGLQERTGVKLEEPLLTRLHKVLVVDGDYETSENIIKDIYQQGLFDEYANNTKYIPNWRRIYSSSTDSNNAPGPRGGHQMCIDIERGKVYLLGGWDGKQDLSDFWYFDIQKEKWNLLSPDTCQDGGPSARSCHKICFDPTSRSIFVLGRYVESHANTDGNLDSDFYRYNVDKDKWTLISTNTAAEGGPQLIYDHEMCVDPNTNSIYVFGGRVVVGGSTVHSYSGLFVYLINSNIWKLLRGDTPSSGTLGEHYQNSRRNLGNPSTTAATATTAPLPRSSAQTPSGQPQLKSRAGHSMLFDPTTRDLYIFAGQRIKDFLADIYRFAVDTDDLIEITEDYSKNSGPDPGYTQRTTIDTTKRELYVFSGYMRTTSYDVVKNSLWVYNITQNKWEKVYQNEGRGREYWHKMQNKEPCPRFAHQMVYDSNSKRQYIFGGNPGDSKDVSRRLNDFWELKLTKTKPKDIMRRSVFLLRTQKLREMHRQAELEQQNNPVKLVSTKTKQALEYLRSYVSPVLDEKCEEELDEFQRLCACLCLADHSIDTKQSFISQNMFKVPSSKVSHPDLSDIIFSGRTRLYNSVIGFMPQNIKEPEESLVDIIKI